MSLAPGSSTPLGSWPLDGLPDAPEKLFLALRLDYGSGAAENELFLCAPKRCELQQPALRRSVQPSEEGFRIELAADRPAFYVHLEAPGLAGRFSDSLFTLLPDRPRSVQFLRARAHAGSPPLPDAAAFDRLLEVRHLRTSYR